MQNNNNNNEVTDIKVKYSKIYYEANKDKIYAQQREYQKDLPKTLECIKQAKKKYYEAHICKKNGGSLTEAHKEASKRYYNKNKIIKPKCIYCNKSIVSIGSARINGADDEEYDKEYHKKCFLVNIKIKILLP
jgi:hypothetical protein